MDFLENFNRLLDQAAEGMDNLCEHALGISDINSKIRNKTEHLIEHILKILLYGKDEKYKNELNHWSKEIIDNVMSYCNIQIKGRNKTITTENIVKCIKDRMNTLDEFTTPLYFCISNYGEVEYNKKELYDKVFKILPKIVDYVKSKDNPQKEVIKNLILN